jgi:Patatin-like phospholipase
MNPNLSLSWRRAVRLPTLVIAVAAMLAGCATPMRLPAEPRAQLGKAEVVGMPGVRYIAQDPEDMARFADDARMLVDRERDYLARIGHTGTLPAANFLAISGGGDDGAFGAGLLCGWTTSGQRPQFKVVTGISTGALIAPFAFLGAKYDAVLRAVYTQTVPTDILSARGITAAVFDDALADNAPLLKLTKRYVTEGMLRDVAAEYAKGRALLIGTANLDARRGVIWNMGAIAASGAPGALELFQRLMVASAAIPGAFPPAMIDVEVGGKRYQEMHVDGGTVAQVFIYPPTYKLKQSAEAQGIQRQRNLYVIRNARLDPDYVDVERQALTIVQRAISSLIHTQGIGDLRLIYEIAQRDGLDYNLAFVPPSFNAPHKENFDTAYIRALFQVGYDLGKKGYPWEKTPPWF